MKLTYRKIWTSEQKKYEGDDNQRYVIVNMTDEIRKDH